MNKTKVLYEELRPEEFLERLNAFPVAYLPLGTLEWHGLHLPLGSDGLQAGGVFKRLAAEIGGVVLPMLFIGPDITARQNSTAYHGMDIYSFDENSSQQLEGSAYFIEKELFCSLLDVVMYNLERAGFKVVIGHGHGPSTSAFAQRKQIFMDKFDMITHNLWELGYEGDEGIQTDHAAANETSLVMSLHPELADISSLPPDNISLGVSGKDPRKWASAKRGEELIRQNTSKASKAIQSIVSGLPKSERAMRYHDVKNLLKG